MNYMCLKYGTELLYTRFVFNSVSDQNAHFIKYDLPFDGCYFALDDII